jgi:hypothetical protein
MRIMLAGGDEGQLLCGAERIAHGQVFARDFFEVMGPGTFYWVAAYFKVFGISFFTTRICLFVSSLGTALAMYFLSRQVSTRYVYLPALILGGTYFGGFWPEISHHVDSNLFGLLAVSCLVLWHRNHNRYFLFGAGALAGITTCILQPKGLYLIIAFVVWVCFQRRKISKPFAIAAILAAGYFAVAAIAFLYFSTNGAMSSLIYADVIFPSKNYGMANNVGYAHGLLDFYWDPWVSGNTPKWLAAFGAIIITPVLFVVSLPLVLLVIGLRTKWKLLAPELTLYWFCAWAFWFSELHRMDTFHLIAGSPLLIIIAISALSESHNRLANIAVQMLAVSAAFLAVFNFCFVLAEGTPVSKTRVGNVAVIGQRDALKLLDQYVSPGKDVFIYPYCPTCYFLSATTNPTRYSFLLYGYNTPVQFHEVVQTLDKKRVKYVLWDTTFGPVAARVFPGLPPVKAKDLIIEPYLQSHYKVVQDDHGILLMERKDDSVGQ